MEICEIEKDGSGITIWIRISEVDITHIRLYGEPTLYECGGIFNKCWVSKKLLEKMKT